MTSETMHNHKQMKHQGNFNLPGPIYKSKYYFSGVVARVEFQPKRKSSEKLELIKCQKMLFQK